MANVNILLRDLKACLEKLKRERVEILYGKRQLHKNVETEGEFFEEISQLENDIEEMIRVNLEQQAKFKNLAEKLKLFEKKNKKLGRMEEAGEIVEDDWKFINNSTILKDLTKRKPEEKKGGGQHHYTSSKVMGSTSGKSTPYINENSEPKKSKPYSILPKFPQDIASSSTSESEKSVENRSANSYKRKVDNEMLRRYLMDSIKYHDSIITESCENECDEIDEHSELYDMEKELEIDKDGSSTEVDSIRGSELGRPICKLSRLGSILHGKYLKKLNRTRCLHKKRPEIKCQVCKKCFSTKPCLKVQKIKPKDSNNKFIKNSNCKCGHCKTPWKTRRKIK